MRVKAPQIAEESVEETQGLINTPQINTEEAGLTDGVLDFADNPLVSDENTEASTGLTGLPNIVTGPESAPTVTNTDTPTSYKVSTSKENGSAVHVVSDNNGNEVARFSGAKGHQLATKTKGLLKNKGKYFYRGGREFHVADITF